NAYGRRLRSHVTSQPDPTAFMLLPVLRHDEMRQLFCACDVGFWPRAAITIQQAMGTGLPVVLKRSGTASHLVKRGRNGWYVELGEAPEHVLAMAIRSLSRLTTEELLTRRGKIGDLNRSYLSYDLIALGMINGLK